MKKIGILLGSTTCSKYLFDTIKALAESEDVDFYFLINQVEQQPQGLKEKLKDKVTKMGVLGVIERIAFNLIFTIEHKVFSQVSAQVRAHNENKSIEPFIREDKVVYVTPSFSKSGLICRYKDQSLAKIKALELDLIVRGNGLGIYRGGIIGAAKDGIISFHHGDNRWNRGGPPAFWEVYLRKPSTGFIIQILTEELDGGSVIFRGNLSTRRTYTENIVKLYTDSNPYLAEIVLDYARSGQLPQPEEPLPYGGTILKSPSVPQLAHYLIKTASLFTGMVFKRLVLGRHHRWGVAFLPGSWRKANFRKAVQIKNPPRRFYADPFVITKNERTICYLEDYSWDTGLGRVTAVELLDKKNYKILGPVVEEPFHLSFPYIFEFEDQLYMVPESSDGNAVRLYKCVDYPMKWEYQKDIFSGVKMVDTMIFKRGERWWLLTNEATKGGGETCAQLMAFYSDHPIDGQWIPHTQNPLVFDSDIGRNGGILDVDKEFPVRVRQRQSIGGYGSAFTLAKITDLTPTSYQETQICEITPEFFPGIAGCHHLNTNEEFTVFDYRRDETLR